MKIDKKEFVEIMESIRIEQQLIEDHKLSKYLSEDIMDIFIHKPYEITLQLVQKLCYDHTPDSWISYYVYELDWGKKYRTGCVSTKKGKPIDISSLDKLYKFLKKNYDDTTRSN